MYMFQLQQDHPDIGQAEVLLLTGLQESIYVKPFLLGIHADEIQFDRLAFSKRVCKIFAKLERSMLFSHKLFSAVPKVSNYKVLFIGEFAQTEKEKMYSLLFASIKDPIINVKQPANYIVAVLIHKTIYVGLQIFSNDNAIEKRKAHLLPVLHPSATSPKIARAMINMTGVKKGKLYDPFCGSGGIVHEGLLCDLETTGSDIDPNMIARAKTNVPKGNFFVQDALTSTRKCDAIVSDLPFGKNTKNIDTALYGTFLQHAHTLTNTMVVGFSDTMNEKIIKQANWTIIYAFTVYVHKSLSRKVFVLHSNT